VIAKPTQSYPGAVMADGPLAFWRLNETDGGNGTVAKDYWGGHNGEYNNVSLQVPGYNPTSDLDTAAQFGSFAVTDSHVANIPGIDFASPAGTPTAFSVEAWVNGNGNFQTSDAGIVTKGYGGGGEQFSIDTGAGGAALRGLRLIVRDAAGVAYVVNSTNSMNQNSAWHHVVGVCDMFNSNIVLYVDGLRVGSATISPAAGINSSVAPVSIGSRQSGAGTAFNNQFFGVIDDVAIYSYALTPAQVLSHYYAAELPPKVIVPPMDIAANEGGSATFRVSAYGAPPLSYQWYNVTSGQPGTLMPGQTSDTLVLNNITMAQNGSQYQVVINSPHGSATSPDWFQPAATLTVVSGPPHFTTDLPEKMFVYAGRTVTLSVVAAGTEPITYVWLRNGATVVNGGRISGAQTATLTIANAQPGDSGNYQVLISNNQGGPIASIITALVVDAVPSFNGDGTGWTLNGGATITGNVLTLTTSTSQSRSAFFNYPLYVGGFRATYTYQDIGGGGADGMGVVIHNDPRGATALGGGGGGMGYPGITPSAGILFTIYNNSAVSFQANGTTTEPYAPTAPVNIAGGNPIDVVIEYRQGIIQLSLTDTVTSATFNATVEVGDLSALVGGETAYIGVTGASGGVGSNQQVSNFRYYPMPALSAELAGPNSLLLSWPASVGGFSAQQSTSVDAATWPAVTAPASLVGDRFQILVSPLIQNQFFRLVLPQP
jgi:hypothetical protein